MFITNKITISTQNEDRTLWTIYSNIEAQVDRRIQKLDWAVSENTKKEVADIFINKKYNLVRIWNIISYIDDFWIILKFKITSLKMIPTIYFNKIIKIKCDLL